MDAVLSVGLEHAVAPVALRERMALDGASLNTALQMLQHAGLSECVILSTCNRVEVYGAGSSACAVRQVLLSWFNGNPALAGEHIEDLLIVHQDDDTARHLARVACGLDSVVLGEAEILGQVALAHRAAMKAGTSGPILGALFRHAVKAGKRARTETGIGRRAASVPSAAAAVAERELGDLCGRPALVIGAGEMGRMSASALSARGASPLMIANRTAERAGELARRYGGRVVPFHEAASALAEVDLVVSATRSPETVVHHHQVARALRLRDRRPLVLLDLAVPRDIDPAVAALPGVRLFDVDSLRCAVTENLAARFGEARRVESIAAEETEAFLRWLRVHAVTPALGAMRREANAIAADRLERTLRRLPELEADSRSAIEAMLHSVVNAVLHEPTVRLKRRAAAGDIAESALLMRDLFGTHLEACDSVETPA